MSKVLMLKCVKCGKEYDPAEVLYTCPDCGIDGILDVVLNYDQIKRELTHDYLKKNTDYSLWRYLPAIPIEDTKGIQPLQVGWTPLYDVKKLSRETGVS